MKKRMFDIKRFLLKVMPTFKFSSKFLDTSTSCGDQKMIFETEIAVVVEKNLLMSNLIWFSQWVLLQHLFKQILDFKGSMHFFVKQKLFPYP